MRTSLFSAKAEYACVAMLELAARFGEPQPIRLKSIADTHNIPRRFLVQILLQLKGAGLIESTRGAAGGYQLSRDPQSISIADVVGVIDSGRSRVRTQIRRKSRKTTSATGVTKIIQLAETNMSKVLRGVWGNIIEAQRKILEETTLARLVQDAQNDTEFAYQI